MKAKEKNEGVTFVMPLCDTVHYRKAGGYGMLIP